ncbi:MAG: formylglycine-generating enzyme family protein [Cyanobacteria bacterium P01_G01_bin.54]
MAQLILKRKSYTSQQYKEHLSGDTVLEMVRVPSGQFWMGSPEAELERYSDEGPQHWVNIDYEFWLGKYPITQRQWKAVVESTQPIAQELDPDPANFKNDFDEKHSRWQRPVEQVSWQDAIEFCARLTQKTGRQYRLPTEAEWEYVCRAVVSEELSANSAQVSLAAWNRKFCQPFYFGETIGTNVVNYNGSSKYGRGVEGEYREQTTPVGYFNAPNTFGLHDMHGNLWEWCLDPWHDNYQGNPPADGAVWDEEHQGQYQNILESIDNLLKDQRSRVQRGGSWYDLPWVCRSAFRLNLTPADRGNNIGFRVLCARPRTL